MFLLLTIEPVLADPSITNPNGKTSLEIRSRAGLTILIRDEGKDGTAVEKRMEYDEKGRLTREILGDGSSNIYFYDGYDRLTKKSSLSEEGEVLEECLYTYDSLGRVTEVECAEGTGSERTVYSATSYTYDALGRVHSETSQHGTASPVTISYTYDGKGNLLEAGYPGQAGGVDTVFYEYDNYGRLISVSGDAALLREISYDGFGRVSTVKDYSSSASFILRTNRYDPLGRLIAITYTDDQETSLQSFAYTYDKAGRITERTEESILTSGSSLHEVRSYSYDSYGRLIRTETGDGDSVSETVSYEYDSAGNRTQVTKGNDVTTFTFNGLDQLTMDSRGNAYSYDERGDLREVTNQQEGERTLYTFSPSGNLLSEVISQSNVTSVSQVNRYDESGRRIRKAGLTDTEDYYYMNGKVILTDRASGMDLTNICQGDEVIGCYDEAGYYSDYLQDIQGSTVSILRDGTLEDAYTYSDYGKPTVRVQGTSGIDNEILYTGSIYDRETGEYYLNARYYDPYSANFLSQDTYRGDFRDFDQWNLYAYCNGDPVNRVDPSGHYSISKAIKYAHNYAKNPNQDYPYLGNNSDCTNFVSQCVKAGGKEMKFAPGYEYDLGITNNTT